MRRRAWPTLLLVAYAALLVLGAWPEAVRPALMDAPAAIADGLLRVAGMRSGVGVFEPGRERIVLVQRNDCIRVRGLRGDAAPVRLEPREGGCRTDGFHPGIPRHEWMLRSLLLRGSAPASQAAVGDFYCFGPGRQAAFEEIEVLWTQPWRHIDSGEEGRANVVLFRWRCDPPALVYDARGPSDAEVAALPASG